MEKNQDLEMACFAGGCFWCIETVFQRLKGVEKVQSGYIGGHLLNPTYKEVCSGQTGHAEAVQISYNTKTLSFKTLLDVFFSMHDPSTLNRQGADIGSQYRSAIFYYTEEQKQEAEQYIQSLETEGVFENKIVTEITEASHFYQAEDYHTNYYNLNRELNGYCSAVIDPKVNKLRKSYAHLLNEI